MTFLVEFHCSEVLVAKLPIISAGQKFHTRSAYSSPTAV